MTVTVPNDALRPTEQSRARQINLFKLPVDSYVLPVTGEGVENESTEIS